MCWTSLLVLSSNTRWVGVMIAIACTCFLLLCNNTILPFRPKSKSESQNFEVSWEKKFQLSWKVSWKSFKWVEFQYLKSLPGLWGTSRERYTMHYGNAMGTGVWTSQIFVWVSHNWLNSELMKPDSHQQQFCHTTQVLDIYDKCSEHMKCLCDPKLSTASPSVSTTYQLLFIFSPQHYQHVLCLHLQLSRQPHQHS